MLGFAVVYKDGIVDNCLAYLGKVQRARLPKHEERELEFCMERRLYDVLRRLLNDVERLRNSYTSNPANMFNVSGGIVELS